MSEAAVGDGGGLKILYMDTETTGLDAGKDRIVDISLVLHDDAGGGVVDSFDTLVNPGIPIPAETTAVHGIRDCDVAAAPTFSAVKDRIIAMLEASGALAGYNVGFDIRMLRAELMREGCVPELHGKRILDMQRIFFHHEPRDLSAAFSYYCGKKFEDAHRAGPDVRATIEVFRAQRERYNLDLESAEVRKYAEINLPLDSSGAFEWNEKGEVLFAFGKFKGRMIRPNDQELMNYLSWIVSAGFPQDTKNIARALCRGRTITRRNVRDVAKGL